MFNFDLEDILMLAASAEYERNKYIQVHNKFQSVRLTITNTGTTTVSNKEITKFCEFNVFKLIGK